MRNISWLVFSVILLLCIAFVGCGYAKKDQIEKQLTDQKMELEQKIDLAQKAAEGADGKADKVLATAREEIQKSKMETIAAAEERDLQTLEKAKSMVEAGDDAVRRAAAESAAKALADAKATAMAEDEKVKEAAKKAADKALSAAEEADRKAVQAAKEAEIAKELPKPKEPIVFTVYFDLGQTKIKAEGIEELKKAADTIKAHPNAIVKVEGHTDNAPVVRAKFMNNWGLSQARAQAVKDYLVKNLGVAAESLGETTGYAFYKPAAANDTGKGRQMNRRAEVIIIPQD